MRTILLQGMLMATLASFTLARTTSAQEVLNKKVTLQAADENVKTILKQISKATQVRFLYSSLVIQADRRITVNAVNERLADVLDRVFQPLHIAYKVVGKQIVLTTTVVTTPASGSTDGQAALGQDAEVDRNLTGTITDEAGETLPGASVVIKGTTKGTSTDANGTFSLSVPDGNITLVISHIGYVRQEVAPGNRSVLTIKLVADDKSLNEVVVTAFGVEKQQKLLGYSVTELKGDAIQTTRETSFVNALSGKIAGVVVQSPPYGPGSSARVVIRGNTSFGNNRQPLYVIDGVPIDNTYRGSNGNQSVNDGKVYGGTDPGDGLSNLNPDDVETISVLKGVSAAALYGNRAQNGVILITTKRGKKDQGLGISFNSNSVIETMVPYTQKDLQQVYGRGLDGQLFPGAAPSNYQNAFSWGPKFGSVATFVDFDGKTRPFVPQSIKDNFNRYFSTGFSTTNSLAFSGGGERSTYRLSLSETSNKSPLPNNRFQRYNLVFRGTSDLGTRLHVDYKVDLSRTDRDQSLLGGDGRGAIGQVFSRLSNTTDISTLAEKDANGSFIYRYQNPYVSNEYVRAADHRDRVISTVNLKYDLSQYLTAQVQGGADISSANSQFVVYPNDFADTGGILNRSNQKIEEDNLMGMLSFNRNYGNISVSASAGVQTRFYRFTSQNINGRNFVVPNLVDLSNVNNYSIASPTQQKKVNSVYGSAQFGYKNYLFLEVTGRNDWSSPLSSIRPGTYDNSLFYPAANLSYVFTDHFKVAPQLLSSGKLRVALGKVGSDQNPHQTDLTFSIDPSVNGLPNAQLTGSTLPPTRIRPESTTEVEIGTQLGFLQNRLTVDFAFYNKTTKDFLLSSNVSSANGFSSVFINAGSMRNRGFELLLSGTPVKQGNFTWDASLNLARNKNLVLSLTDQLAASGVNHYNNISSFAGSAFASIYGDVVRKGPKGEDVYRSVDTNGDGKPDAVVYETGQVTYDASGQPLKDANGAIIVNHNVKLGNGNPTVTGGFTNTFRYKNVNLSFLIDGQFGGQIYSDTHRWATFFGNANETLVGRDGTYVPTGLINASTNANSPEYVANTLPFSPYQQYTSNNVTQLNVFNNSFMKLRQVSLGYTLSSGLVQKAHLKAVTFSLIARNLFYLFKDVPIIDPNSSDSIGSGFGYETASLPASRTYGFNLNVQF